MTTRAGAERARPAPGSLEWERAPRGSVAADRYGAMYVAWEENRDGSTQKVTFARAE